MKMALSTWIVFSLGPKTFNRISTSYYMRPVIHQLRNTISSRTAQDNQPITRCERLLLRTYSSTKHADPEDDKPIAYSKTQAAMWSARQTFGEIPEHQRPPFIQAYVVVLSVAVFLIYFCILREENDIDMELSKPLYERVEGLEELHIKQAIANRVSKGADVSELKARLVDIKKT